MLSLILAIALAQRSGPSDEAVSRARVEEFFAVFDESHDSDMRPRDYGFLPTFHCVAVTKDGGFVAVGSSHDLAAFLARRGYVVKYAADGTIERVRSIGGALSLALAVAVAEDGRIAVAGTTQSATFPYFHTRGAQHRTREAGDPFVIVFSPDLTTVEMSLAFGGGGADIATSIAFDSEGRVCVAGGTESYDANEFEAPDAAKVKAHHGGGSVFLMRIEDGSPRLVDFVATNCLSPAFVACGGSDVILAGVARDGAFQTPTRRLGPCGASNYFVSRYDTTGKRLFLVTLGGTEDEHFAADALIFSPPQLNEMCEHAAIGGGLAIDAKGRAVLCGCTESADLPSTHGAYQTKPSAPTLRSFGGDGFVAIVDAEGNLARATYLSTHDVDEPGAIAIADNGDIVIGGRCHDRAWIDGSHGSDGYEGFVLRLDEDLTRMIGHAGFIGRGYQWVDALAIDREGHVIAVGGSNGVSAEAVEFDAMKARLQVVEGGWHAIVHRFE